MTECATPLDPRVDRELIELSQRATRLLPDFVANVRLELDRDGLPADCTLMWLTYLAAEVYGYSDAALICILHNRGRQSRILERQCYECLKKAEYYVAHPDEARLEFLAWPFREKRFRDDLRTDTHSERYRAVERAIRAVTSRFPEVLQYADTNRRERPFREMVGDMNAASSAEYAFHYRRLSQTPHGSVMGMEDVFDFRDDGNIGVRFDSRLEDPNFALQLIALYVIGFLDVLNRALALERGEEVDALQRASNDIMARLRPEEYQAVFGEDLVGDSEAHSERSADV
jgi:hypothetical protein